MPIKYTDLVEEEKKSGVCPFCPPVQQEKYIENDNAYLTYALAPYHPDHLLVVPKRHMSQLLDATPKELMDIDDIENRGIKILHNLGYKNISIVVREGDGTGKTVDHTHYHIVPDTHIGDLDHKDVDMRPILSEQEVADLSKRIKSALP